MVLSALVLLAAFLPAPSLSRSGSRRRTSGRLLGKPNPIKCSRRPKQLIDTGTGHYYFISDDTKFKVKYKYCLAL
jgi:hypothetical protein